MRNLLRYSKQMVAILLLIILGGLLINDLTVNVDLAKAYLGKLNAPVKGFYTFENSAHSPLFEEPLRVKEIIEKDVLKGRNSLADHL